MKASVLLSSEYFDAANTAIRTKNKVLFNQTCDAAGIPVELRDHMWNVVDAAYETVYSKKGPFIMW